MNETEIVIVTIITICPKLELVFQRREQNNDLLLR